MFKWISNLTNSSPEPAPAAAAAAPVTSAATQAETLKKQGNQFLAQGDLVQAEACYRQAIATDPAYAEAYNNLGIVLQRRSQLEDARAALEQALRLDPSLANAHYNLGSICAKQEDWAAASAHLRQALVLKPDFEAAYLDLAFAHYQAGEAELSRAAVTQGLTCCPGSVDLHVYLGNLHKSAGRLPAAITCYRNALALKPDIPAVHLSLGDLYWIAGELNQAENSYRRALALQPGYAEAHFALGNLLLEQHRSDDAVACYQNALAANPAYVEAHNNLGNVLKNLGQLDAAAASYAHAAELGARGARVRSALMLPPIMGTQQEVQASRDRFALGLDQLIDADVKLDDPLCDVGLTNFYLAFHGLDDRDLQVKVARYYANACPALLYVAPHCTRPPAGGNRIRIGFLSKFVYTHSVSRCVSRIVENLSQRDRFEVALISSHNVDDKDYRATYAGFTGQRVHLPHDLAQARERVAALELDILVYLDIGMEPLSYFLAFARLARAQCVWAGHPVTTGIANMDYFLSSAPMEPEGADAHYSETLIRFPIGMYYFVRPQLPSHFKTRSELGFPADKHLYMCPMALQKLHPDFDAAIARILQLDPQGVVVLFADGRYPSWQALTELRLEKTIPADVRGRVLFSPWLTSYDDFISANAVADVILDPFHFGIGSTVIATFAVGTPLVTKPGEFMRGRMGLGYYQAMGVTDCIAADTEAYCRLAVSIATTPPLREQIRTRILATSHAIFENPQPVNDVAEFFVDLANKVCSRH